jgi:hypothetical protein
MTTCAVLRCQTPGSTVVTGGQHLNQIHESYVCAEHYEKIQAGDLWDVHDHGQVVMGQDMPPLLTGWKHSDSRGTRGFVLSLKTSDPEAKPFDVFITPDLAKHLNLLTESRRGE